MGIKGLSKLLSDEAPDCIREVELKSLHGRKIAIDASMAIYQFLIAVRTGNPNHAAQVLTNADGETTSHIQGMFNRTIRFVTDGIQPAYVFDGKPPSLKSGELQKRREKRQKAEKDLEAAKDSGNIDEQTKQEKRLVRAGHKENLDCQKLLTLMGVPVIVAPCEAEAQAASLAKEGLVYATATEDMDALTFATPVLLRKMTFANQSKSMVQTMNYQKAVDGLQLKHEEFVDLCILMGCDYTDTIRGVGPKTALKLIREHHSIEGIIKAVKDNPKYVIPNDWIPPEERTKNKSATKKKDDEEEDEENTDDEAKAAATPKVKPSNEEEDDENKETAAVNDAFVPAYVSARKLFHHHEVLTATKNPELKSTTLKWKPPQRKELTTFLVDEMGFDADRVGKNIDKLEKAHKANTKPQARMDSFFKVLPQTEASKQKKAATLKKRKADEAAAKKKNKKGTAANKRRR